MLYVLRAGNAPAALPALQLFVMTNMLLLFRRFYAQKYRRPGGGRKAA